MPSDRRRQQGCGEDCSRESRFDTKSKGGAGYQLYWPPAPRPTTDYYFHGVARHDPAATDPAEAVTQVTADPDGEGKVQDVDGVFRNYAEEPYDKVRWTFAPPVKS